MDDPGYWDDAVHAYMRHMIGCSYQECRRNGQQPRRAGNRPRPLLTRMTLTRAELARNTAGNGGRRVGVVRELGSGRGGVVIRESEQGEDGVIRAYMDGSDRAGW